LIPFSLLLWALLAIVTLVGWVVLSVWLGERLESSLRKRAGTELHPLIPVAIGALLLTGATFFAWSLAECLGLIMAVLLGSTGTGAVLVHLARRAKLAGGGPSGGVSGVNVPPPSPSSGGAVVVTDPTKPKAEPTDAGLDHTTASFAEQAADEEIVESASGIVESEETESQPPTTGDEGFVTGEELGLSDEAQRQLRRGAGLETPADDFTRIRGIGPAFNRRLNEAGVTRFAQLATMTPEQIAEIVGWPPERVIRDQLREQAADLAAEK
jgi:predicted flap endonuclease-1-like 5' DNA nuclease